MTGTSLYTQEQVRFVLSARAAKLTRAQIIVVCAKRWHRNHGQKQWDLEAIKYIFTKAKEAQYNNVTVKEYNEYMKPNLQQASSSSSTSFQDQPGSSRQQGGDRVDNTSRQNGAIQVPGTSLPTAGFGRPADEVQHAAGAAHNRAGRKQAKGPLISPNQTVQTSVHGNQVLGSEAEQVSMTSTSASPKSLSQGEARLSWSDFQDLPVNVDNNAVGARMAAVYNTLQQADSTQYMAFLDEAFAAMQSGAQGGTQAGNQESNNSSKGKTRAHTAVQGANGGTEELSLAQIGLQGYVGFFEEHGFAETDDRNNNNQSTRNADQARPAPVPMIDRSEDVPCTTFMCCGVNRLTLRGLLDHYEVAHSM